jgi:membrane-bound O-acyltransferase GUP1_2
MNLLMMMTANLVGFVLGTEGMVYLAGKLFGTWEGAPHFLSPFVVIWYS